MRNKILIIIVILIISSCEPLMSGYVSSKNYEPSHSYQQTTYIMVGKIFVPQINTVHVKDKWTVTIQDYDKDNKLKRRVLTVSESKYNKIDIGDYLNVE